MEASIDLINSIAALLWPLIAILIVLLFRKAVGSLLESARSRKFSIRLGGQELTMDEVSAQQERLIADLQTQVVEVKKRLDALPAAELATAEVAGGRSPPKNVLWVDDRPKNNSYFIEQLTRLGIKVDTAESTRAAKDLFGRRNYDCVISDLWRHEDGEDKPDAGIEFLRYVRAWNRDIPYIVFASARGVRKYRSEALSLGASGVTNSSTELFEFLNMDVAVRSS